MQGISSGIPPHKPPQVLDASLPGFPGVTVELPAAPLELPFFKNMDEIRSIPGYTESVDPKAGKLARLRGQYSGFKTEVACGLKGCREGHKTGVVVETINGEVTNIGHVCGAHYFPEYQQIRNKYEAGVTRSRRIRTLRDLLESEPILRTRIENLRGQPLGADWLNNSHKNFFLAVHSPVINELQERARRGQTAVTKAERVYGEEAERTRQFQSGLVRTSGNDDGVTIEREVGRLRGLGIWKGATIRDLLYEKVIARLDALGKLDLPQLPQHELKEFAEWAESIDQRLAEVEALIREGREFFKEENLALLATGMTWGGSTAAAMRALKWDYATGTAKNPAPQTRRR